MRDNKNYVLYFHSTSQQRHWSIKKKRLEIVAKKSYPQSIIFKTPQKKNLTTKHKLSPTIEVEPH